MSVPIFDASSSGHDGSGTNSSLTVSHTITGTRTSLIVFAKYPNANTISDCTFNGVSMTNYAVRTHGGLYNIAVYYMYQAPQGTHDIVMTTTANCVLQLVGLSYRRSYGSNGGSFARTSVVSGTISDNGTMDGNAINVIGLSYSGSTTTNPVPTPASGQVNRINDRLSSNNGLVGSDQDLSSNGSYTWSETINLGGSADMLITNFTLRYQPEQGDALFFDGN